MEQYNNFSPYGYQPAQNPVEALKEQRRQEKHGLFINASKLGALLLLYEALTYGMNYVFYYFLYFIKSGSISFDRATLRDYFTEHKEILNSSFYKMFGNLFIVILSMIILLVIARFAMGVRFDKMLKPEPSHIGSGVKWFPLSMTMNYIVSIIISILVSVLSTAGITVPEQDFSMSDSSTGTLVMQFLYVVLLGPVCEELLYRGVIITLVKPYGKGLAVFTSALMFGAMHGNIPQFASAFAGGLVFAAVAVKYDSIVPTIIIHILNNTVASIYDFTDVLKVSERISDHIYNSVFILVIVIGFYILFTKLKDIKPQEDTQFALTAAQRRQGLFLNIFILIYFCLLIAQYISSFVDANL